MLAADPCMATLIPYDPSATARQLKKPAILILTGATGCADRREDFPVERLVLRRYHRADGAMETLDKIPSRSSTEVAVVPHTGDVRGAGMLPSSAALSPIRRIFRDSAGVAISRCSSSASRLTRATSCSFVARTL